jgi:hypothetical protein
MAARRRKPAPKKAERAKRKTPEMMGIGVTREGMKAAAIGETECRGLCSGLGASCMVVDDEDCEDALPPPEVIKYAKKIARDTAEKMCTNQAKNCFCYGKFYRLAVGSVPVREGDDDTCLTYAIYYYSGKCTDTI